MSTQRLTTKSSDRVPTVLIWKQPLSLWLIPLISLFIASTLPLIASKGLGWSIDSHAFVLIIMSFVLAHRFFGFAHDMAACDFYFALPGRRSRMFFHLNIASITYLLGPSALIALLNTLLYALTNIFQPLPPEAYTGSIFFFTLGLSGPATILSLIALYLKIIYLFIFLELFYLLSDKAGRANTMALLINLFWPIVIYLYTDATLRFLPGFPDKLEPLGMPFSPWYELLFRQLLSPLSAILSMRDFDEQFWVYTILPVAAWLLCRYFFIKRQVEYARLSAKINWPFAITQWIGVLSITLLGGYACHFLRALIYGSTKSGAVVIPPAPFLIGCGLGLILSLWIFNLIRGKGKLVWKPLVVACFAVLIPFNAWLGVVMSGANGYSERWPEPDHIQSIDIFYPDGNYLFLKPQRRLVTLENRDDIADISALVFQVFNEKNLGIDTPRTLQSRTLSDVYVLSLLQPHNLNTGPFYLSDTPFWSELSGYYVDLVCHTADGATIRRSMVLPHNPANPHYRNLLLRNNRFLFAEYGGSPSLLARYEQGLHTDLSALDGVLNATMKVETTKENLTTMENMWQSRLVAMACDDQYEEARLAEFFAQNLCEVAASDLLSQGDDVYRELLNKAPFIVHVHLTYSPNRSNALNAKTDVKYIGNSDNDNPNKKTPSVSHIAFDRKTDTSDPNKTVPAGSLDNLENNAASDYNVPWTADLAIPVDPESREIARFLEDMWLFMRVYIESGQ